MPKDKKPRRRSKPAAPKTEPAELDAAPQPEPRTELVAAPPAPVVVESGSRATPAQLATRLASAIRTVAVTLIDIADATAEALTKQRARQA